MAIPSVEKKRVLIIEDDSGVRGSLNLLLSKKYDVSLAGNGAAGLSKLQQSIELKEVPDIILLDLVMPEMGGLEFLKKAKKLESESQVIVLTATNSVETAVEAMKSGATNYISKPFDVEKLLDLVDQTAREAEHLKNKVLLSESQVRRGLGNILEEAIASIKDGVNSERKETDVLKEQVLSGEIALGNLEEQLETKLILEALEQTNYVQTKAAAKLGITRRVLKYKIDKLGLANFLKKKKESRRGKKIK